MDIKNISIRIIDASRSADINIKNEPFEVYGTLCPSYADGKWSYERRMLAHGDVFSMCFPDENYSFDAMSDCTFIGAYDGDMCIGLAIMQEHFLKYMYLYDLKVSSSYRRCGIGKMLIEKACELASGKGYRGIYTVGQDNNLAACDFYLKNGFIIGGFDNKVYTGTSQEGKADIIFYLDI